VFCIRHFQTIKILGNKSILQYFKISFMSCHVLGQWFSLFKATITSCIKVAKIWRKIRSHSKRWKLPLKKQCSVFIRKLSFTKVNHSREICESNFSYYYINIYEKVTQHGLELHKGLSILFLDQPKHFLWAFCQFFLDSIDVKIVTVNGNGLKFGIVYFLRQ